MKKSFCFLMLFFVLSLIGVKIIVALPQYQITDPYNSPSGFYGGPFYVDPLPLGGTDGFVTFCLEKNEYFFPGSTYWGSIEGGAIFGGVGGQTSPGYDPLDIKTQFLYSYFLDNQATILADMDKYTGMQLAIWRIENEIDDFSGYSGNVLTYANEYYNMSGTPTYNIMVLNLWKNDLTPDQYNQNDKVQSQLIRVPEPSTLILMGAGLLGLGVVARRRKK